MKAALTILIILSVFAFPSRVAAFETDQYNLPPVPIADIGDEVSEYTKDNILEAIRKINDEIRTENDPERIAYLRSEDAVAREVFKRLGAGFIAFAKAGTWMDTHDFRSQPARYKTGFSRSIYALLPTNYFTISPTVNIYGSSFGTDKIAHFFQQGYTYFRIYKRAVAKGSSKNEARAKAVGWGRMTEHTYYGTMVGGVFSNADLAANYAGMKFYEGLTRPVMIGERMRPATLNLKEGIWVFSETIGEDRGLLKPFISDHLDEALNPSVYVPGLRSFVRRVVRKQACPQWIALYPGRTKGDFEMVTSKLKLWNGEGYGAKKSDKFVTIAGTCFGPDD